MARTRLPHDAKAGPTKPEVRSVTLDKLGLDETDHFVEVGSCTGAVTIEAARRAGRVTALERKAERLAVTRQNLTANGLLPTDDGLATDGCGVAVSREPQIDLRNAEAPAGLPGDADAVFLGGSRNYEAVLDHAVTAGIDRVVMNVARLEVAGEAVRAFRERGLLDEVVQLQVGHGYELAGATSFDAQNPVYIIAGSDPGSGADATDATDSTGATDATDTTDATDATDANGGAS